MSILVTKQEDILSLELGWTSKALSVLISFWKIFLAGLSENPNPTLKLESKACLQLSGCINAIREVWIQVPFAEQTLVVMINHHVSVKRPV